MTGLAGFNKSARSFHLGVGADIYDGGLGRSGDNRHLVEIVAHAGAAKYLRQVHAREDTNGQTVRFGDLVNVVGADNAAGAGHVLDHDCRVAGNMLGK